MTIYLLEVTPTTLGKIQFPQYKFAICSLVCERILRHFHNVVPETNSAARCEIERQRSILVGTLDLLQRSAINQLPADPEIVVHYLFARKKASKKMPIFASRVYLDSLQEVPSVVLIGIMTTLINSVVVGIYGATTRSMSVTQLHDCVGTLKAIPKSIAWTINLEARGRPCQISVEMKVEVYDLSPEVKCLTYPRQGFSLNIEHQRQ